MANMSEFDFDELDKAVAGAISTDTDFDPASNENLDDTNMSNDLPVVNSEPAQATVLADTTSGVLEETTTVAPAARRSSGRFMDVVHPSSDMRTRSTPAFIGSAPAPSAQSFTPPVTKTEESSEDLKDTTNTSSDTADTTQDSLETAISEWSKPLESPFLSDAKVAKRPLGGFGPIPSQVLLDAPEEELKLEASDEPLLEATFPDPIDFAAQAAAPSFENEDTGNVAPVDEEAQEEVNEVASEQSIAQLDELEAPKESTPPVLEVTTNEAPIGPTSITQQYTEQTSAAQQSGAIFDTENYHKPLTVTKKKQSGVWTIIWILLLVILGAGAGVAFYLFVLPML